MKGILKVINAYFFDLINHELVHNKFDFKFDIICSQYKNQTDNNSKRGK